MQKLHWGQLFHWVFCSTYTGTPCGTTKLVNTPLWGFTWENVRGKREESFLPLWYCFKPIWTLLCRCNDLQLLCSCGEHGRIRIKKWRNKSCCLGLNVSPCLGFYSIPLAGESTCGSGRTKLWLATAFVVNIRQLYLVERTLDWQLPSHDIFFVNELTTMEVEKAGFVKIVPGFPTQLI